MFNLQDKIDRNFAETPWGIELTKQIEEELTDGIYSLENISNKLSVEPELSKFWLTIRDDIDKLTGLKNNLDNWDKAYEINQILHFTPQRSPDSPDLPPSFSVRHQKSLHSASPLPSLPHG